jgi:ABC-2 type transport system ATP-binding protein
VTPEPIVQLHDVGRRYRRRWAVRGIELAVNRGEMVGIVGPDGAGKTTLLQMCAAILDPTEGACRVLSFDTVKYSKAVTSRIGYMSQGFTLYDRLSVEENLRFFARIRAVTGDAYAARRARLLEMTGLEPYVDRPAGKLSGGMRKKLSLCTNLIHEPALLLLDEPGLGVDALSRRQLWTMLETFRGQGIAIVVATSYMDEAERCDRVLLLRAGSALVTDRPEAVRKAAAGRVFELAAENPTAAARDLAEQPGLFGMQVLPDRVRFQRTMTAAPRVSGAHEVTPTLEDVFVLHAGPSGRGAERLEQPAQLPRTGGMRAEAVTVEFGDFRAVDAVSIEMAPGGLLALLGPNGAGKTTLIRAFCGLVRISSGAAWIGSDRVVPEASEQRQHIGYMSQRFSLYRDLTLGENLAFFASAYGLERAAAREAIQWARAMTELSTEEAETPVAAMSGATRQRLALACSILHRPSVLFLDEPTSGVDPVSRYRFWQLIRVLAGAGMVVVVTTHYLEEAAYCDRIGLMHRGRLIALGSLDELREQTGTDARAPVETVFVTAIQRAGLAAS